MSQSLTYMYDHRGIVCDVTACYYTWKSAILGASAETVIKGCYRTKFVDPEGSASDGSVLQYLAIFWPYEEHRGERGLYC